MVRVRGSIVVAAVVGFVLGAGCLWLLAPAPTAVGTLASSPRGHVAAPDAPAARAAEAAVPAPTARRSAAETGIDVASPAVAAAVESLSHAVRSARTSVGAISIEGHVVDEHGAPVVGVRVFASRLTGLRPDRATGDGAPDLEQRLRDTVGAALAARAGAFEAATDAAGAYRIEGLEDGVWRVGAAKTGFDVATTSGVVSSDAVVDFVATALSRVTVHVFMPDGTAATEAAIVFGGNSQRAPMLWMAERPWLELAPGTYLVHATLGDPETGPPSLTLYESDAALVRVKAGGGEEVTLVLRANRGIAGRLTQSAGEHETGLTAWLRPVDATTAIDPRDLHAWTNRVDVNPNDGTYRFANVARGSYAVGVTRGQAAPILAHAVVMVGDEPVKQDLVLPPLDPSQCVVAHVHAPDGSSLTGVRFVVSMGEQRFLAYDQMRAPGEYWIVTGMTDPAALLVARSDRFGAKSVALPSAGESVELAFGGSARLKVVVTGAAGLENKVEVLAEQGRRRVAQEARLSAVDGGLVTSIFPFEPGIACVHALLDGREVKAHPSIELADGENQLVFQMPTLYTLDLEVPNAGEETSVQLSCRSEVELEWRGGSTSLDKDGRVSIHDLAAGEYLVEVGVLRYYEYFARARQMVHVPAAGTVRITGTPCDALLVWTLCHGPLVEAGFEDGDEIISIDGRELRDVAVDVPTVAATADSKEFVAFTVVRKGSRTKVTADLRLLLTPSSQGGVTPCFRN